MRIAREAVAKRFRQTPNEINAKLRRLMRHGDLISARQNQPRAIPEQDGRGDALACGSFPGHEGMGSSQQFLPAVVL